MTLGLDPIDPAEVGMSAAHLRFADELMQRQEAGERVPRGDQGREREGQQQRARQRREP